MTIRIRNGPNYFWIWKKNERIQRRRQPLPRNKMDRKSIDFLRHATSWIRAREWNGQIGIDRWENSVYRWTDYSKLGVCGLLYLDRVTEQLRNQHLPLLVTLLGSAPFRHPNFFISERLLGNSITAKPPPFSSNFLAAPLRPFYHMHNTEFSAKPHETPCASPSR